MDPKQVKDRLRKIKKLQEKLDRKQKKKDDEKSIFFNVQDNPEYGLVERIPTGIMSFDKLTGGGLPRGRFTQISGPSHCGKTTITLNAISQVINSGGIALYIDAEHTGDLTWMKVNGVDVESPNLFVAEPSTLEEGLDLIKDSATEGLFDLIIYDSVVALSASSEKGRDMDQETIALIPRKLSQFFRMATAEVATSKTAVVFINQVRTNINAYGAPQDSPGGEALKHGCSLKIQVRRGSTSGDNSKRFRPGTDKKEIGFPMTFKVEKSKITSAYDHETSINRGDDAVIDFYYGSGFDHGSDVVNLAIANGLIEQGGGGYYTIGETRIRGKDALMEAIETDTELVPKLRTQLAEEFASHGAGEEEVPDSPDGGTPPGDSEDHQPV